MRVRLKIIPHETHCLEHSLPACTEGVCSSCITLSLDPLQTPYNLAPGRSHASSSQLLGPEPHVHRAAEFACWCSLVCTLSKRLHVYGYRWGIGVIWQSYVLPHFFSDQLTVRNTLAHGGKRGTINKNPRYLWYTV